MTDPPPLLVCVVGLQVWGEPDHHAQVLLTAGLHGDHSAVAGPLQVATMSSASSSSLISFLN